MPTKKCPYCQEENRSKAVFCSNCGKKISTDIKPDYEKHVKGFSIFFFTLLGYIAVLHFIKPADYTMMLLSQVAFIFIIIVFFIIYFREVAPLFRLGSLRLLTLFGVLISACIMAFAVCKLGDFMNKSLFNREEYSYYEYFGESSHPLLMAILFIGVVPALFEELAFRGILFNELLKILPYRPVIIITSLLFTLLHFSLLSVIWLFPGAIAVGYLRAKYNTLNYGILAHFTYNTSIVFLQVYYNQ
ncbi:MAG: CPBP family intramembrane glutamic endopeptidase [Bacteroidia bacterium]